MLSREARAVSDFMVVVKTTRVSSVCGSRRAADAGRLRQCGMIPPSILACANRVPGTLPGRSRWRMLFRVAQEVKALEFCGLRRMETQAVEGSGTITEFPGSQSVLRTVTRREETGMGTRRTGSGSRAERDPTCRLVFSSRPSP